MSSYRDAATTSATNVVLPFGSALHLIFATMLAGGVIGCLGGEVEIRPSLSD